MDENKSDANMLAEAARDDLSDQGVGSVQEVGTKSDRLDMWRMGKKQEFRRGFRFLSIFGFIMVLMATWEAQLNANVFGLINGGTGGLIWMYLGTFAGFFCAILSMSEMASMAPTTGGQYHWVSEFAPPSCQRFLSYLVGWLCVLGWQVSNASIAFLTAQQIQGLIILNNNAYAPQRWHLTLIAIAVETLCQLFNSFYYRQMPLVETLALVLHLVGFFAILIPLWVKGPRTQSASAVFFTFADGGEWGNSGLACLVGILSPIFSLMGPDSATHMAEELCNASKSLPRAMLATALINGAMGFVMIVTFCMVLGEDVQGVLATQTAQPFIQMFYNAVGSKAGATGMTCIMVLMAFCGVVNIIATSSRQLWAFARDQGVPFSGWFSVVDTRRGHLPINALMFSYVLAVLLSLINIGSTVAFNILTSVAVCALLFSYAISIGCMAVKRLRREPLLPASFTLGRAGLALNIFSVLFLLFTFVMTFFPTVPHPTAEQMNWNILIFGVVVLFSFGYYIVVGRHHYAGPVAYIQKSA